MGCFDYVYHKTTCPNCGCEIDEFQTKDGSRSFETLGLREVNNFYSSCKCGFWLEYKRKPNTYKTLCSEDLEEATKLLKKVVEYDIDDNGWCCVDLLVLQQEIRSFLCELTNDIQDFEFTYYKLPQIHSEKEDDIQDT